MKINLTQKLSKSLLLASATLVLSLSSAQAGIYTSPENGSNSYTNITDLSGGSIIVGSAGTLTFSDSTLGTSSSRFSFAVAPKISVSGSQTFDMRNTVLYVDAMDFSQASASTAIKLYQNSMLHSTVNINVNGYETFYIDNSTLYAPRVDCYSMRLSNNSTATFEGHLTDMQINSGSTWNSLSGTYVSNVALYNSTWGITEYAFASNVTLADSKIEILLDSPYASALSITDLTLSGINTLRYDFTDDFIETLIADYSDDYPFVFSVIYAFTIVSTYGDGTWSYDIASSSDSYTWTVTDLGYGNYRFTDFVVIPEPSTYALIFGALALGLAIYRRRK